MNAAKKVAVLRDALSKTKCTYQYLYKVPKENFGVHETPEMHHLWCVRCLVLYETRPT